MRTPIINLVFLAFLLSGLFLESGCARRSGATVGQGPDISVAYLQQARQYRDEGRYDLARQSYAQALSTCRSNANLEIIKHELAGCELLIRTMR